MFKSAVFKVGRNFLSKNARALYQKPDFTKNNFSVTRGPYGSLEESHLNFFQNLLGNNRVVTDPCDLERYNVDWMQQFRGNSKLVLKPKSTEEVSKIMSFCNQHKLAVCPMGGNTGMVGSVPVFDEIVLSMELMNNVIELDSKAGILTCEAGCVLENLNTHLEEHDLVVPLDLGSRGSCHIGGTVSTNAGGLRMLRYGNMHGNVLGLEVVKANGEVLNCLNALKKDNTGYHLKNLFIGSEGTLGVVTKVALQCPPKFKSLGLAFLGLQSYEKVLEIYSEAKKDLGEIISAVEVLDDVTVNLVRDKLKLNSPLDQFPYYMMIETLGSNEVHDSEKLNNFLQHCFDKNRGLDGVVTSEPTKYQALWSIRERVAEAIRLSGYGYIYDFTLPLKNLYTIVDIMKEHIGKKAHVVFGFGHLGDGNLHFQVITEKYTKEMKQYIEPYVYNRVKELNGSISAEHGIGFLKIHNLATFKDPTSLQLMKDLKNLLDPNRILNPYKVLLH